MVRFFLFEYEAGSVVLDALESVDGGVGKAREGQKKMMPISLKKSSMEIESIRQEVAMQE